MRKIRVIIVDDSSVIRKVMTRVIESDPELEVVGTAATGSIALSKIEQLSPDIITLDVIMPDMDGLETLKEIRRAYPWLPVIMVSSLTERGAVETIEALSIGAADYILKPTTRDLEMTVGILKDDLIGRIKALGRERAVPSNVADLERRPAIGPAMGQRGDSRAESAPVAARPAPRTTAGAAKYPTTKPALRRAPAEAISRLVVIGVSTGGPQALAQEIPKLPPDFRAHILIVQHMPAEFTGRLAERLAATSAVSVREASPGANLSESTVWIAPGGRHLIVRGPVSAPVLQLLDAPPENSCRPAADVLFRSAAALYGRSLLGVVLTGMGQDALLGSKAIREAGGKVWAQDKASSVVWGMPGSVVNAKMADRIISLDRLATQLTTWASHSLEA